MMDRYINNQIEVFDPGYLPQGSWPGRNRARCCPTCGRAVPTVANKREQVKLARLLNRLRAAEGGLVSHEELTEAVWGDESSGGPDGTAAALRVMVHKLRRLGYPIRNEIGRGYRFVPSAWEMPDLYRVVA